MKTTGLLWLGALVGLCAPVLASQEHARTRTVTAKSAHKHAKHEMPSPLLRRNEDGTFASSRDRPADKPFTTDIAERATLTITPNTPMDGVKTTVTVEWSDIPGTTGLDWLAFYSPSDSPIRDYMDFVPNLSGAGSGSVVVDITNMRTDVMFRYVTLGGLGYINAAESNLLEWRAHVPMHGRLALTDDPTEMRVNWNSDYDAATPEVEFGTVSGSLDRTTNGTSHTYVAEQMCGTPARTRSAVYFRDPGHFHDVLLQGLTPATTYYYRYGQEGRWSEEFSFTTAPRVQADQIVRFGMLADHGTPGCFRVAGYCGDAPDTVTQIKREIEGGNMDMLLHVGDISYALGNGYLWEFYGLEIEPMATLAPYMIGVGNHEYCYRGLLGEDPSGAPPGGYHPPWGNHGDDSYGECAVPTFNRFHMPDTGNGPFWYSFDYGNVHIVQVSSEHDIEPGSRQHLWLDADLAGVDRSVTPWVIVTAHRPMYSSERYPSDYNTALGLRAAYESLLLKHDVDLTLAGHYHAYERTCPVFDNECCPAGQRCPVHLVAGMAGIGLDGAGWYDETWSEFVNADTFGFLRVEASANKLQVDFVASAGRAPVGEVVDTLVLER